MFSEDFVLDSFEISPEPSEARTRAFLIADTNSNFSIFLLKGNPWLPQDAFDALLKAHSLTCLGDPISIGQDAQFHYFVAPVNGVILDEFAQDPTRYRWQGLRECLADMSVPQFSVVSRGVLLARWRIEHRFCGRCGRKTSHDKIDAALICRNCRLRFYPRIAPCMIVLIERDGKILLAHHKRSKKPTYSPLAGFIESGETAEEAVAREVFEEVGIRIKNIRYFSSQAWPFPSQLMLGFFADYASGDLTWSENEFIDVKWFGRDELPRHPSEDSIAGQLIAGWTQAALSVLNNN